MNRFLTIILLTGASALAAPAPVHKPDGKGFTTADAAAQALVNAAKNDNIAELVAILGPSSKTVVSSDDPVADRQMRHQFATGAAEKLKLVPNHGRSNEKALLIGKEEWPLPIPIVEVGGQWYFDTARGKQEIMARRIGGNELDAIDLARGYVEAQHEYGENHRTPGGVPYYAQKLLRPKVHQLARTAGWPLLAHRTRTGGEPDGRCRGARRS